MTGTLSWAGALLLLIVGISPALAYADDSRAHEDGASPFCIGLHQIVLPRGAVPRVAATYAGLRDQHEGAAVWGDLLASLHSRASAAQDKTAFPSARALELYRAAGVDPETAFSDSRLVGFDVYDGVAVIAEHDGPAASFTIEAHQLLDGQHYVFKGEGSLASRYPSIRDGILETVSRYRPRRDGVSPLRDAFCSVHGAYLIRDGTDVAGDAQLVVTFPEMPEVTFSLTIYGLVGGGREQPFLQRVARDFAGLVRLEGRVRKLHGGRRKYGGQQGRIAAVRMPSEDGPGWDYRYFWHAPGRPMDAYAPEIEAELVVQAAHGFDRQAVDALWLELMKSLTLR